MYLRSQQSVSADDTLAEQTRKLCYHKDYHAMHLIYIIRKSQSNLGRAASIAGLYWQK